MKLSMKFDFWGFLIILNCILSDTIFASVIFNKLH